MLTLSDNIVQHRRPKWSSAAVDLDDETSVFDREYLASRAKDVGRWMAARLNVEVYPFLLEQASGWPRHPCTVRKEAVQSSAYEAVETLLDLRSIERSQIGVATLHLPEGDSHPAVRWDFVRASLDRWETLKDGWAGEGSTAPAKEMIEAARQIVSLLEIIRAPIPMKFIDSAGEFGFRWTRGTAAASIVFAIDRHLIGFIRTTFGDVLKLDRPIADAVLETGFFLKLLRL